jgi:hypothetical protein
MTLEWKDPPPPLTTGAWAARWRVIVAELRERPGEWAIVQRDISHKNGYVLASKIRNGFLRTVGDGCEARFVLSAPRSGTGDLYVRYVGDAET